MKHPGIRLKIEVSGEAILNATSTVLYLSTKYGGENKISLAGPNQEEVLISWSPEELEWESESERGTDT